MASHDFEKFRYSPDKAITELWAVVAFGATGAPTLEAMQVANPITQGGAATYAAAGSSGFRGVTSITRTSTGLYVATLDRNYTRILGLMIESYQSSTGIPASPNLITNIGLVVATPPLVGSNTFTFQLSGPTNSSTTTLAATDPVSGSAMVFRFTVQNSMSP